jgi:hypothetical protein
MSAQAAANLRATAAECFARKMGHHAPNHLERLSESRPVASAPPPVLTTTVLQVKPQPPLELLCLPQASLSYLAKSLAMRVSPKSNHQTLQIIAAQSIVTSSTEPYQEVVWGNVIPPKTSKCQECLRGWKQWPKGVCFWHYSCHCRRLSSN